MTAYKSRLSNRFQTDAGSTIVVAPLVVLIIFIVTLGLIDLSRLQSVRNSVYYSLSQTLRKAQSEEALLAEIWDSAANSANKTGYINSRRLLNQHFLDKVDSKIRFTDIRYDDLSSGESLSLAYLPPGCKAEVNGQTVTNSIQPLRTESLRDLASQYPTEISAYPEVDTFLFGKKALK